MVDKNFSDILDRLIAATQHRFPDLAGQASDVRYHYFERPAFEATEAHSYAEATAHLDALEQGLRIEERDLRINALVQCPQPLKNFLTRQFDSASPASQAVMLEVLTRRYYRIRNLEDYASVVRDGQHFGLARYQHEGRRILVVTTVAHNDDLVQAGRALAGLLEEAGEDDVEVVADFYVWQADKIKDDTEAEPAVAAAVSQMELPMSVRRVVVAISGPGRGLGMAGTQHFTYRRTREGDYGEDKLYRGIHPMMAKRMRFERLQNFSLTRLPSVEDVYLFVGVAHDNQRDERTFALAEVRDVSPVHDDDGRTIRLLGLERKLSQALAVVRACQTGRPPERRLQMNEIDLYVWPALELTEAELHDIVYRLAPAIEGLGVDEVSIRTRLARAGTAGPETLVQLSNPTGAGFVVRFLPAGRQPVRPFTDYEQKVARLRRRGLVYPYELVKMLTPSRDSERSDFPPANSSSTTLTRMTVSSP